MENALTRESTHAAHQTGPTDTRKLTRNILTSALLPNERRQPGGPLPLVSELVLQERLRVLPWHRRSQPHRLAIASVAHRLTLQHLLREQLGPDELLDEPVLPVLLREAAGNRRSQIGSEGMLQTKRMLSHVVDVNKGKS